MDSFSFGNCIANGQAAWELACSGIQSYTCAKKEISVLVLERPCVMCFHCQASGLSYGKNLDIYIYIIMLRLVNHNGLEDLTIEASTFTITCYAKSSADGAAQASLVCSRPQKFCSQLKSSHEHLRQALRVAHTQSSRFCSW